MFALTKAEAIEHELMAAIGDRPAVTVTFPAQPSLLALRAARRAVADCLRAGGVGAQERAADAFSQALMRHSILSWGGIGDEAGNPVDPTPDVEILDDAGNVERIELGTISHFLAEPRLFEAADNKWVLPWALLDAEKNGSSLSLNGTSARAMPEADTASSAVTSEDSADAATTTDVLPAPTTDTRRVRKPAKPSGN